MSRRCPRPISRFSVKSRSSRDSFQSLPPLFPSMPNIKEEHKPPTARYKHSSHPQNRNRRSSAVNYTIRAQHPPADSSYHAHPQQHSAHPQQLSAQAPAYYQAPLNSSRIKVSSQQFAFDKEFGPFGPISRKTMVVENDHGGDINSMFQRPDYQPIFTERVTAAGFRVIEGTQVPCGEWQGHTETEGPLPPTTQPVVNVGAVGSRKSLTRNEDLDRILAKYGKGTSRSNMNTDNNNRDPDFASLIRQNTFRVAAEKYCGAHPAGYWDNSVYPQGDVAIPQQQKGTPVDPRKSQDLLEKLSRSARESQPMPRTTQISTAVANNPGAPAQGSLVLKRSTHVFPFKETSCGHLVIDPGQIAFESRKISVLVADPNSNNLPLLEFSTATVAKLNQVGVGVQSNFVTKNERILHEVKKAMSIAETTAESQTKNYAQQPRDINQKKYSDSKKATEDFEKCVLQRIIGARNADTQVVIGDKVFPCHSIALEAYSGLFDRLIRPQECIQRIQLPEGEVSATAFPVLMNWIVQSEEGRGSLLTKENIVAVYAAAKHLAIKDLEQQCIRFLDRAVAPSDPDLLVIWESVRRQHLSLPELVKIIAGKIAASYQDIFRRRVYLDMDVDELFMILNCDDIAIESEMDVYESAVNWLLHDWKNRKLHTNKMMSAVRFGLLSPLQLTQINLCPELDKVKNEKDYNQILTYGTVKSMLDDALAYSILGESYKSQPEELRRWMEKTGIKGPAPRAYLLKKINRHQSFIIEKIGLLEDASKSKLLNNKSSKELPDRHNSISYTVVNEGQMTSSTISEDERHSQTRSRSRSRSRSLSRAATRQVSSSKMFEEISKPKLLTNHSSNIIQTDEHFSDCDNAN